MINLENINILLIFTIIYFFYYYTKIPKLINDNILDLPKVQQYTPTTEGKGTSVDGDFSKFKNYQKINPLAYSEADRYWKRFLRYKKKAEKLNTYKNHQYFENAVLAFQKSINHLQSIGINTTEKEYKDGFNSFYPLIDSKKMIIGTRIQIRKSF